MVSLLLSIDVVERLSGAVDILPVLVPESVLCAMDLSGGDMLEVSGQIRTFNNRTQNGRRLVISVYAERLVSCQGEPRNDVQLTGTICKEPIYRQTPMGMKKSNTIKNPENKLTKCPISP